MRKNYLPFGLITACLGFSMLLLSALTMVGQPGNPNLSNQDGSRFESIRANQKSGLINPGDLMNARLQADALRAKSTEGGMNLNWVSMGPDNYPGLVWSAIFDKSDLAGQTLIAGTEAGGVWKSTNLGLSWTLMPVVNDAVLKTSSLIQVPNGTIYAATGIMANNELLYSGTGIFKSLNGEPFSVIPSTQTNNDFSGVSKLAVDPITSRLYAATYGGLYFTDDENSWTLVKAGYTRDVCVGPDGTVLTAIGDSAYLSVGGNMNSWITLTTGKPDALPKSGIGWITFAIAPSNGNIMYASVAKTDGRLLNIYTSIDKGTTWSVIFPSNPSFEPFGEYGKYANTMVVFPNDPDKLYLGGENMWYGRRIQPTGYFNWELVSYGYYSPWVPNSAPAMHHSYMFSPVNSNKMVIATDGGVCIATSTTTGLDYFTSNKNLSTSQFLALAFSTKKDFVMGGGANIGTLAMGYFYPTFTNGPRDGFPVLQPNGLMFGSNGGTCVWSNLDYNVGVFSVQAATPIYKRQDFRDLTYDNDFMNGIASVSKDPSPMHLWESFTFSQTQDSVKVYARAKPIPADTLIQVTSANGVNFPYLTTAPLPIGDSITIADPVASRFFYYGNRATAGYGYGIHMTKDMLKFYKTPEYFIVLQDTANKVDFISAFTVSNDLNTLWAGTKKGRLIRVTGLINATDSLTANAFSSESVLVKDVFTLTQFDQRVITDISINPTNSSQVLVTLGNYGNNDYVYYSSNANSSTPTFTSVQSNLPTAPVFSGLIELQGANAIVSTDAGVFSTNNLTSGNPQWGPSMQRIGDVVVTDIRQQTMNDFHVTNYGVIYLASFGRGLWMDTTYYSPVGIEPIHGTFPTAGALNVNPNPAKDIVSVSCSMKDASVVELSVFDMTGRLVLGHNFGFNPKGIFQGTFNVSGLPAGSYMLKIGDSSGKLIKL